MRARYRQTAERVRSRIESGCRDPSRFRAALLDVPPIERDAWVDLVLGLGDLPDDDPGLPRDCVPYLPCPVDILLRVVDHVPVRVPDVFVDVGCGVGRAAALVHLLTGASVIGLEIQPHLAAATRDLAVRLRAPRIACVEGDAAQLTGLITIGSVFFLYCPFGGKRMEKVLADLEPIARTRTIRVCSVQAPLPPHPRLTLEPSSAADLTIYRSNLCDEAPGRLRA